MTGVLPSKGRKIFWRGDVKVQQICGLGLTAQDFLFMIAQAMTNSKQVGHSYPTFLFDSKFVKVLGRTSIWAW